MKDRAIKILHQHALDLDAVLRVLPDDGSNLLNALRCARADTLAALGALLERRGVPDEAIVRPCNVQGEPGAHLIRRGARLLLYGGVHGIFLEEPPRIADCYALARTKNLVIVPFFISDGLHTQEDIPVLLGEPERVVKQRLAAGQPTWRNPTERNGRLVWYSPAVGTEPHVADVILERVREAARMAD